MIARKVKKIKAPEIWRQYLDTNYWASDQGRIKKVYKNGNEYEVMGYWHRRRTSRPRRMVKIYGKEIFFKTVIWVSFKGKVPDGYAVAHRNGLQNDNSLYNLYLTTPKELGEKTGHISKSQKVINLDTGKIYRSAKAAGDDLSYHKQSIADICNNKRKRQPIPNLYWWNDEDEIAYRGKYVKPVEL